MLSIGKTQARSSVIEKSLDPVWNQIFVFIIEAECEESK
jgi:hypothetical protein